MVPRFAPFRRKRNYVRVERSNKLLYWLFSPERREEERDELNILEPRNQLYS